jgi:hypothetical protein
VERFCGETKIWCNTWIALNPPRIAIAFRSPKLADVYDNFYQRLPNARNDRIHTMLSLTYQEKPSITAEKDGSISLYGVQQQ